MRVFPALIIESWGSVLPSICAPPLFFTAHTWKRGRPLVVKPASAFALTGGISAFHPSPGVAYCGMRCRALSRCSSCTQGRVAS